MRLIPVFNILFLLVIMSFSVFATAATKKTEKNKEKTATTLTKTSSLEEKWLKLMKTSHIKKQIITLKSNKGPVIALYLEQTNGRPQGGIIILHGRLQHPDWRELIAPLRKGFPKFGWTTLSIQLSLHSETADKKDYLKSNDTNNARISTAITFLHSRKIHNIVIIGYELGANTAARFLLKHNKVAVQAFISISLLNFAKPKQLNANRAMSLLKLPILDVYAMNDTNNILNAVKQRKPLIKQHRNIRVDGRNPRNALYRQLEIEGADHSYSGYEEYLIKRVRSWLRVFAPGKSVTDSQ